VQPEGIARVCHEVNRAYCRALGDNSQPSWHDAPEWQRDSALEGVRAALADPNMQPGESHAGWMEHKRAEGWVYGPLKNPKTKEHPCMVPFDELPDAQRAKDFLFLGTVRALADVP
jgi:hypothetical protein